MIKIHMMFCTQECGGKKRWQSQYDTKYDSPWLEPDQTFNMLNILKAKSNIVVTPHVHDIRFPIYYSLWILIGSPV